MSDARRPEQIDDIIKEAAAAEGGATPSPNADLMALADRIELLAADFGRWTEYKAASVEYVREFSTEVKWHRWIRALSAGGAAVMVIFLMSMLVLVLSNAHAIFGNDPGHGLTALIIGCIGGSVLVVNTAVKGAFATLAERNEGLPMPEHLKTLVETVQGLVGKH